MDEIEVTARFDRQGNIIPVTFVWRKQTYQVQGVGRHWQADDGRHILVIDLQNQTYHLIFKTGTARWYLFRGENVPGKTWI